MKHSRQILEELEELSELVASLPVVTPYEVPATYFGDLPALLAARVLSLPLIHEHFQGVFPKLETPYQLPDDYFEKLPSRILAIANADEISSEQELEALSPLLLKLRYSNTLQVPGDYFSRFPVDFIAEVERSSDEELFKLSPTLQHLRKRDTFKVPEGYFEQLGSEFSTQVDMFQPVSEVMPVTISDLKDKATFTIPLGYFGQLPALILSRIKEQEILTESDHPEILSPLLGKLKNNTPFKLPEGFFEEFPADIAAGVRAVDYVNQELESHMPVPNDLKIQNLYEVPHGYFDHLETTVLNTVKQQKKGLVISGRFNRKVISIAAAALIAGIMSIAAWSFFNNGPSATIGTEVADMQKISNDEIINYLDATPVSPDENELANAELVKGEDAQDLLADVPDGALQEYLDKHTVSKDLLIN